MRTMLIFVSCCYAGCVSNDSLIITVPHHDLDTPAPADMDMQGADLATVRGNADFATQQSDMSRHPDLDAPADMSPVANDLSPVCGVAIGSPCCAGAQPCATRDPQGQFLVCQNAMCVACGLMGQVCCANNWCAGGNTCAGPLSSQAGHCN